MYHFVTNSIYDTATRYRHKEHITVAWQNIFDTLQDHGKAPEIHILNNECSADLIHAFKQAKVQYQLVPPHRRNLMERDILIFKKNLIVRICTCNPNLPA